MKYLVLTLVMMGSVSAFANHEGVAHRGPHGDKDLVELCANRGQETWEERQMEQRRSALQSRAESREHRWKRLHAARECARLEARMDRVEREEFMCE